MPLYAVLDYMTFDYIFYEVSRLVFLHTKHLQRKQTKIQITQKYTRMSSKAH